MTILTIVGARPNFIKAAALYQAFLVYPDVRHKIVHTGQHADPQMSDLIWAQLALPRPDYHLGISGGSGVQQMAKTMLAFESVLATERPDWVVVVGDVNATLACALVAARMDIPLAHVEAGLRSGDRRMPEETNRRLTDALSDCLFVTESAGLAHLAQEGIAPEKVHFVGNCMIDTLATNRAKAATRNTCRQLGLLPKTYILMTMHRPSNVDTREGLEALLQLIAQTALRWPLVFPMHPRTRERLAFFGLQEQLTALPNLYLLEPQGYLDFVSLMDHAAAVLTDSGGIQEETTWLGVPCLTFRNSTERPVTVDVGSNTLLAQLDPMQAVAHLRAIFEGRGKKGGIPPLWDGQASARIAAILTVRH